MNIRLFALVWITTFILVLLIMQAIRDHKKIQDMKQFQEEMNRATEKLTEEHKEKRRAAEAEERAAQEKAKLAEKIAAMNEEQLAAFNKALDEPKKEYVPVYFPIPAYKPPVMVPYYGQMW